MKGKPTKKVSKWDSESAELCFPVLSTVDKGRSLHCYSAVLARNEEDGIVGMDELDSLQAELEAMLSAVAVRFRTLHAEISSFNSVEENRKGTSMLSNNVNIYKKRKTETRVPTPTKNLNEVRDFTKVNSSDSLFEPRVPEHTSKFGTPKNDAPKNDTPNKFWLSVEPYCAPITQENIKDLEEMISNCEADGAGINIPPLGKHYSERWGDEDMMDEKDAGSGIQRKLGEPASPDAKILLKKASSMTRVKTVGPIVQRMISALIEEKRASPLHESCVNSKTDVPAFLNAIIASHTSSCFNNRLRRNLEAERMIEADSPDEENDEILTEIKRCDEELKVVANQNREHLKRLLGLASKEIQRQEIRNKIKALDVEILDIYCKTTAAKKRNVQLQEKVKEQALKALKDRESLLKSLDSN